MTGYSSEWELRFEVVSKAVVAVMLAGVVVYSVVAGVPISDGVMRLVILVLGAYFGFSAGVSRNAWDRTRNKET
ncbi:hypothetical protein ES703_103837 [subsurface metagenome]